MKKICMFASVFVFLATTSALGQTGYFQGRDRSPWYIGFGVGGGGGVLKIDNTSDDFDDGGLGAMFKVGGVINNNFLVGFEVTHWRYQEDNYTLWFHHYDCVVTYFPFERYGFFIKGGIGFGVLGVEIDRIRMETSEAGLDLKVGMGYEFKLGKAFHLGGEFNFATTTTDDYTSRDGMLLITFSWY